MNIIDTRHGVNLKPVYANFTFAALVEVVPMAIVGHKGHESRTNLPLGNDDDLFHFRSERALWPRRATGGRV